MFVLNYTTLMMIEKWSSHRERRKLGTKLEITKDNTLLSLKKEQAIHTFI
jgi:hypothetical protein